MPTHCPCPLPFAPANVFHTPSLLPTTIPWPSTNILLTCYWLWHNVCNRHALLSLGLSWLCATHWTEVDFMSLQFTLCWLCVTEVAPVPHAPVGLKASRSVFPDLVFLSLLILPGHHPSYIDVYSCLHSFEPHTHINHYRFSFSIGVLSSLLFHYISSRLRYIFWSLMLNSQCSNHHFFNLLVTCIAHNNLLIVTVLPAICTACYDPSTDHVLKQYSTLCSGTATPTHLLGGVHREDDSGSWLRAVILCQRCPLFIYYNKCDVWLDHMTCDMCCLL